MAWILETTGAAAEHLPMLSIIRTVNNGPQSHIWNVFHSVRTWSKHFYSTLVVLAILDALALQFTSTLLITDFGPTAVVPGAIYDDKLLYSAHGQYDDKAGNIQAGVGVDFYQTAPSTYARFAEYAEPPHLGADYADTGATLRAFLPFESENRSVLRSYEGPATVFDARIRCTTPSISVRNITFLFGSGTNSNYEIAIAGQMKLQGDIPGIVLGKNDKLSGYEGAFLHSVVARIYWANSTDWRLSFSIPLLFQDVQGFSDNVLDPENTGSIPLLLMNATGNGWQTLLDEVVTAGTDQSGVYSVGPFEWTQTSSGVWADLSPGNASLDVGLSATLCFANLNSNNYVVRVDDGQDFPEPKTMTWEAESKRYNTSRVRQMLDRSDGSLTPKQRGILTLHSPVNWTSQEMDDGGSDFLTSPIQMGLFKLLNPDINLGNPFSPGAFWGATAAMTPFSDYNGVHRTHAALFQDIIQNTGNPALAFQAFFTVLSQMTYYDLLPQFDIASNASYSASVEVDVPTQWTGFIVVMVLLAIHAGLVITAVVLFLTQTNHSLLGNAWQAVAQVLSSDTMDTLHSASYMTDLEVKRLLRMNRYEDNDVVLRTGADGGRSQSVYRKGTGGSC
ncbi:hypothetical protein N0V94_007987 [Neodidymelliopsis sp. IMI 364377]|nr:hypothetical protein N0V94_007987 [Neodidymelliopsis sp. IMI 364377]